METETIYQFMVGSILFLVLVLTAILYYELKIRKK